MQQQSHLLLICAGADIEEKAAALGLTSSALKTFALDYVQAHKL